MRCPARITPAVVAQLLLAGCLSHHAGRLPGEPRDARFAEVRGTRMHYVDEGDGPAVVLIHGFASSLGAWKTVRPALQETHRVLAMDLKGFGWTDRPEGDYSPQEQARLVLGLMEQRGIERAAIVGHSYGASVALALALMAPDRVRRIALYAAWVYEEQLPTMFHWAKGRGLGETLFAAFYDERPEDRIALGFYDPEAIPQSFIDEVEARLQRPGTRAAALATVRQMRYRALQQRYAEIEHPALLLWGREDRVSSLEVGEQLSSQLPRADLKVYPRCGHFPMLEATHASTRDLVAFLRGDLQRARRPREPVR